MNIHQHFNHTHGYFRDDYDSGTALSHQDVEDVEKVGKYLTFFSRVDLAIFVARTCFQNIFGSVEINWKHINDFISFPDSQSLQRSAGGLQFRLVKARRHERL